MECMLVVHGVYVGGEWGVCYPDMVMHGVYVIRRIWWLMGYMYNFFVCPCVSIHGSLHIYLYPCMRTYMFMCACTHLQSHALTFSHTHAFTCTHLQSNHSPMRRRRLSPQIDLQHTHARTHTHTHTERERERKREKHTNTTTTKIARTHTHTHTHKQVHKHTHTHTHTQVYAQARTLTRHDTCPNMHRLSIERNRAHACTEMPHAKTDTDTLHPITSQQ